jgi:malate/lactate dehydrogenase
MKIAVIGGAGTLGSCAAFTIIDRKLADELLLIDPWADMLKGHWMDLSTAASGADLAVKKGGYEDMAGSDIVIMAASAPSGAIDSRSELLPINIPIIKENSEKINRYCPEAIVIMETNPVDPLNYAMFLMSKSKDRRKFIGYSLNDTLRFRMWAAEALGVQASRVRGTVIGEHGQSQVMLFSSLRVDGARHIE